jgi:hypothetical protein
MSPSPDHRAAPLFLWRAASRLITTLFNLFGGPEDLAFQHTLTTPTYRLISNWLRSAEALVRHLIFLEATAYPKPEAQAQSRSQRKRKRREVAHNADNPEDWRVSFRCVASVQHAQGDNTHSVSVSPTTAPKAKGFHSAWPLAERFEALLRAHNDPAPYARRLARRIHATPRIIAEILRAPVELARRIAEDVYTALRIACAEQKAALDST